MAEEHPGHPPRRTVKIGSTKPSTEPAEKDTTSAMKVRLMLMEGCPTPEYLFNALPGWENFRIFTHL